MNSAILTTPVPNDVAAAFVSEKQFMLASDVKEKIDKVHQMLVDLRSRNPPEVNRILDLMRGRVRPCPFCGGKANVFWGGTRDASTHHMWGHASVSCETADCRGRVPPALSPLVDFDKELAAWNRRPTQKRK
jgi:hypothetical protein